MLFILEVDAPRWPISPRTDSTNADPVVFNADETIDSVSSSTFPVTLDAFSVVFDEFDSSYLGSNQFDRKSNREITRMARSREQ